MGQRHQVYLVTNKGVVGIHHKWLYGYSAIEKLQQFLKLLNKIAINNHWELLESKYNQNDIGILSTSYSIDSESGYYHRVSTNMEIECEDPLKGDNNDGITIIDVRHGPDKIKYCFMSINGLECRSGDEIPMLEPLTASQYFAAYYPREELAKLTTGDKDKALDMLKYVHGFELMSRDEVSNAFPKGLWNAKKEKSSLKLL